MLLLNKQGPHRPYWKAGALDSNINMLFVTGRMKIGYDSGEGEISYN